MQVRTRFAPSPTGFMHIGNLRTALYEYLIAKSQDGKFVLRIEDTDQERLVDGAVDVIYDTLKKVGLQHDEGPDIGGDYGPYIQSQRKGNYLKFAEQLVREGKAYYCFCTKEELEKRKEQREKNGESFLGYDGCCRKLSKDEVREKLENNTPYVIRQKTPSEGKTSFIDSVFGEIAIDNSELEDQILIKADGFPTYNFANVIDDHLMNITHVVRGCEYLSSTPKYNQLYDALGFDKPVYVHLPLIMGKDENGEISKLSKRHGATSFEDLTNAGYLPEAIINYIALLGWCPEGNEEIFSLSELCKIFSTDRISKSPSVFDYEKLKWFNTEYIKKMSDEEFLNYAKDYVNKIADFDTLDKTVLVSALRPRISFFNEIPEILDFLKKVDDIPVDFYTNKKSKSNTEKSVTVLKKIIPVLEGIKEWNHDSLYNSFVELATNEGMKNGTVMWPVRIAASGKKVTPGGAVEVLMLLGKEESIKRLKKALDDLEKETAQ